MAESANERYGDTACRAEEPLDLARRLHNVECDGGLAFLLPWSDLPGAWLDQGNSGGEGHADLCFQTSFFEAPALFVVHLG